MTPTALKDAMSQLQAVRPHDPWPDGPWRLSAVGREWACSTDGQVMVLVERDRIDGDLPDAPLKVATMADKWIARPPLSAFVTGSDSLRLFVGVGVPLPNCVRCNNTRTVECDTCEGEGEVDCECRCGHCHESPCEDCEDGKRPCGCVPQQERHYSRFAGGCVNRSMLRAALEVVPLAGVVTVEAVNLNDKPQARVECFRLRGDGWCVLVMGLRDFANVSADFDKPETWQIASTAA